MNNIIYDNEKIIGTMENIWKFFKEEITREMQDNTISFEVMQHNFNDMLEVMKELEQDKNIYPNTLIKIEEHPMGGYIYKTLKEDK